MLCLETITCLLSLIVTTEDESFKEKEKVYTSTNSLEKLGADQVHIRFRLMTDYERNQIKDTVQRFCREANSAPVQPAGWNNPSWVHS